LRPDLGLALVSFSLSFFLATRPLPPGLFWPVESLLFITALGFAFKEIAYITNPKSKIQNLKSADWAALILLGLSLAATLAAPNFGVSMFEWRVLVAESILFYFLVRLGRDYGPASPDTPWRWAWRLSDAFVAGVTFHAVLALWLYFFTGHSVLAEGVQRAMGPIYGSPNNLALFLDRAWPLLLAVAFFSGGAGGEAGYRRRWGYGLSFCLVSLTLYLTFSKGALIIGLPSALLVMTLLYLWHRRGRHGWRIAGLAAGGLIVMMIALLPLSQTRRFQTLLDFDQGSTGFFRLKVWQAALEMLADHWILGVGLNNFLYQYRTRYILPEAWQEPDLSHPHNLVLDFGTRLGLGGIFLLGWLQVAFWRAAWRLYGRRPEPLVLGLMGSMVVFLSHGLVDNAYFLVDLAFAFFLTMGLVQRLAEVGEER
jgi:O-antigen ligase